MDPSSAYGGDRAMSVYEAVLNLVGPIPAGYEVLVWVFAAVVLLYMLTSVFSIIASVVNWISGK